MKSLSMHGGKALLTWAVLVLMSISWVAEAKEDEHHAMEHSHDAHGSEGLSLNHGEKWQSDASLRQAMQAVSDSVSNNLDAFHHGKLTKKEAETLAHQVHEQVNFMIANCKLEPKADATLHVLISEMLVGAENLSQDPQSMKGLPEIVKVLKTYPTYFHHESWVDALQH